MVARLAESAALAIDADPILVKRSGALFTISAKCAKQNTSWKIKSILPTSADKIAPHKSAAIIQQHVQEGLQLATFYKLPQRIIDFIPMHHGTMLIRYFYVKALDEAANQRRRSKSRWRLMIFGIWDHVPIVKKPRYSHACRCWEAVSHVIDTNDRDELEEAIDKIFEGALLINS